MRSAAVIFALLAALAVDARGRPPQAESTTAEATTTTATTTTTTDVSDLSDYALEVLEAAQAAMSAGTCGTSAIADLCTGSCATDSDPPESVYIEYEADGYRYIISNSIPDHGTTEYDEGHAANPNDACENLVYLNVSANPTLTGYVDNGMGVIGIAVTSGFFYNPLSNPTGVDDVAVLMEGESFDTCNGHADQSCHYHYHDDVSCVSDSSDCPLVGYLLDGVAVYGYCTIDDVQLLSCYKQTSGDGDSSDDYEWAESDDCHLDENNGYSFEDGSYGYVLTDSYPYTPPGYMAEASTLCYF